MPRGPDNIVPHVLVGGSMIAIASGFVALRLAGESASEPRLYIFTTNVLYWLLWTALAPAVLWLSGRVPLTEGRRARSFCIHIGAGIAFALTHLAAWQFCTAAVRIAVFDVPVPEVYRGLHGPTRLHTEWEITMYWGLVGLAHAVKFRNEARARALRAIHLESQLAQARLQALQRQLQPHFLFNTLQTISALVHRDVAEADRMIERLGDLLRMTLGTGDAMEVPLADDLAHVRTYAAIEQANMGDRLSICFDVRADVLSAAVPPLLLQPLVENAVRHGLAPRAAGGRVTIRAWRDGGDLQLRVEDNGLGLHGAPRLGVGLENTRKRLAHTYGARHHFSVESAAGGGVIVLIRVPMRELAAPMRRVAV